MIEKEFIQCLLMVVIVVLVMMSLVGLTAFLVNVGTSGRTVLLETDNVLVIYDNKYDLIYNLDKQTGNITQQLNLQKGEQ